MQHIFREENQLADHIANLAANKGATLIYGDFKQVPKESRQIINTNKAQILLLRIKIKNITV